MGWGDMESRYDPIFYRSLGYSLAGWPSVKNYAIVKGGKRIPVDDAYSFEETGLYYLRVDNLTDYCEITGDLKWISPTTFKILERYRAYSGDVLVSIAGTVGRVAVFGEADAKGPTILTENCAKLHVSGEVLPKYLALLLASRPLQAQMKRDYIQTTIPKLGLDRIRRLRIPPIPEIEQQKRIVGQWQKALANYRRTLANSSKLLASIDAYLLAELGITLPPETENTIANRMFTTRKRELSGWRFDARVHRHNFSLASVRYRNVPLKQVTEINPRTAYTNVYSDTLLTFVPMEAISDEIGAIVTAQERPYAENSGYTSFQEGDLLWAKITPCMENGKSAVAENLLNGYGFGSTEYHVLRPKTEEINIYFLHALLRLKRLRRAATNYFGGSSGHQRVDEAFFRHLEIPLPPVEVQNALVAHIAALRNEAINLRQQAEAELEQAKRRIESLLLGEIGEAPNPESAARMKAKR